MQKKYKYDIHQTARKYSCCWQQKWSSHWWLLDELQCREGAGWGSQEGPRRGKSSLAGGSARLRETLPVRAESSFPGVSFGFTRFEIPTSLLWEFNANSTKRTTSNARKAQWDQLAGLFFFPTHPVACRAPAQTHGHTQLRKHTDARIDTCKHFVAFSFYVICQRNTGQDGVSRSLLIQSIQKPLTSIDCRSSQETVILFIICLFFFLFFLSWMQLGPHQNQKSTNFKWDMLL